MSDWGAVHNGVAAAKAGLDLEMPSGEHMCKDTLLPLIKNGSVPEEVINDKIRRMLRMYYRFNLMDTASLHRKYDIDKAALAGVALDAARGGIVLLKNANNTLPLDLQKVKSIAVLGPNAETAITGGGGSSLVLPYQSVSVLEAIKKMAGDKVNVSYTISPFHRVPVTVYENTVFEPGSLKGEYFNNRNLEGQSIVTRNDANINFVWDETNLPSGFKKRELLRQVDR